MFDMPNVHVRDVPPETLDSLKAAAKLRRRSLNAEMLDALVTHAERADAARDLLEQIAESRRAWADAFPDGVPPGLEPEALIRRTRDAH